MKTKVFTHQFNAGSTITDQSFSVNVERSLQNYINQLEGKEPIKLYDTALAAMEVPLLKVIMCHTNGNESKAAKILGIGRSTLRKKLTIYKLQDLS